MAHQALAAEGTGRGPLQLKSLHGRRPKLLLAEDSDPIRVLTAAMLKGMGCDVDAVVHGEQAVMSASENRFDVIVLDIEMPIMDGITAARSIRRDCGLAAGTPLMALSAFLADSVRTGQWRDTFDIALPKPANKNELHGAVEAALSWRRPGGPSPQALPPPPVLDQEQYEALRSGLAAGVWQELADLACRDIENCISQLENLSPGRQEGITQAFAGKLRGLGRTFAAPRLALLAKDVQMATSEEARRTAIAALVQAARATVSAIRA